jgi:ubiquitin C-terminal hydrolase
VCKVFNPKENNYPKSQSQKQKKKKKKKKKKKIKANKIKEKNWVSVLKFLNFSWMNCVLLSVLAMLDLNNMALETNILLFILLEQPTLTNTAVH